MLAKKVLSVCWRFIRVVLTVVGGMVVVWQAALSLGMVLPTAVLAEFDSPGGRHQIYLTKNAESNYVVDVSYHGIHIFGFMPVYSSKGSIYGARWQSEDSLSLFVSEDFQFENKDVSLLSDDHGEFRIRLVRLSPRISP